MSAVIALVVVSHAQVINHQVLLASSQLPVLGPCPCKWLQCCGESIAAPILMAKWPRQGGAMRIDRTTVRCINNGFANCSMDVHRHAYKHERRRCRLTMFRQSDASCSKLLHSPAWKDVCENSSPPVEKALM